MSYRHPDTIGIIDIHGIVYEIDWPHRIDDETTREDYGVIYRDGVQFDIFYSPLGHQFETENDVMAEAFAVVLAETETQQETRP